MRNRVKGTLKRAIKQQKIISLELVGCPTDVLIAHLESKFKPGMNWGNHGLKGWHIDHIKPVSSFDLTDMEQAKECFHYTNLQPLWATENLKKGGVRNNGKSFYSSSVINS
jgi:hypothetical protein